MYVRNAFMKTATIIALATRSSGGANLKLISVTMGHTPDFRKFFALFEEKFAIFELKKQNFDTILTF